MDKESKLVNYEIVKKSMFVAYLFWFLFGYLGIHRFYTRNYITAVIQLLITVISFIILYIARISIDYTVSIYLIRIGMLGVIINIIWIFLDLFLTQLNIKKVNFKIAKQCQLI